METMAVQELIDRKVVTDLEVYRVARVVEQYPDCPFFILVTKLHKFIKDVKPAHYMIAGYLTGHRSATVEMLDKINKPKLWVKCN